MKTKSYATYGVIGMIGLFLTGAVVGYILNGSDHINRSNMSKNQCNNIAEKIIDAARSQQPELIAQLNKVYSENCLGRDFNEPKPQPKVEEDKIPETTCGKIEMLLTQRLNRIDSPYSDDHIANADIYEDLSERGCAENAEKYKALVQQELQIAHALKGETVNMETCTQIERVLTAGLECTDGRQICGNPYTHINNAKIYANLSERGCAENSEKYKQLAKQELEIARAIDDDKMESVRETQEIIETYKRIKMQAEAAKMIEKAKKLTNPAIDFIIQLEKIIEE